MPESAAGPDPEQGWVELVAEALERSAWSEAGRSPETFDLQAWIPELALQLADGRELAPAQREILDQLSADPECEALLHETIELLAEAGPTTSDTPRDPSPLPLAPKPQARGDSMMIEHLPHPLPPTAPGHSTPVLLAVALSSAAAAIALFAWLAPGDGASSPQPPVPAPVSAVVSAPASAALPVPECAPAPPVPPPPADTTLDDAELAQQLLGQARKHVYSNPARAYALAEASMELDPSPDTRSVLAVAACRNHDLDAAQRALSGIDDAKARDTLVEACKRVGLDVE